MIEQRHYKELIPLFLIIFIDSLSYFLIVPVLLRLYFPGHATILPQDVSLHTRNLLFGITMSLSPFAALIASPIIGHLSDIKGRRITMFYCLSGAITGFVLPIIGIYYKLVSLVIIGRVITGASSASQPIAQAAITDFTSGKQKSFYLSLIAFAMTLAMMLGPLAGGYLSDHTLASWFNTMTPYWVAMGLAVLNIILMWWLFIDRTQVIAHMQSLPPQEKLNVLWSIIRKPVVLGIFIVFLFMELAWSNYFQNIFLILRQRFHYSTDLISFYTFYVGGWMCIGLTVLYKIALKYWTVKRILTISMIGLCIGLWFCNITLSPTWQWLFVIPVAIFTGTSYTAMVTLASNHSSKEHQGWLLGAVSALLFIAFLITGFAGSAMVNVSIHLTLGVSAGCILIGLLSYWDWCKRNNAS